MRMLPRTVCFQLATRCLLRRISPSAPTAIARMAAAFAKGRGVALLSVSCACSARIGYHPSALSPLRHRPSRVDAADAVPRHVKASAVMADGVGVKGTGLTKVAVVDPSSYEEQLHAKIVGLQSMFAEFHLPEVEVFRSAPSHYRMRAEFRVWHDADDSYYVMFDSADGTRMRYRVDEYPTGSKLMNALMGGVRKAYTSTDVLRRKLYQVNFHTTLSGEAMVTMVYHRALDDVWVEAARAMRSRLAKALAPDCRALDVVGRSHKQRIDLDRNHVVEVMTVNGRQYQYKQVEGAFAQPNGGACQHMLAWAQDVTRCAASAGSDLLELYCGNGNFTLPLAHNFRQVVATEVSKTAVEAARENMAANGIDNIFIARMSSEEFTEAWTTQAQRNRLKGLDWAKLALNTLLVDPPRAGLDDATVKLLERFQRVVYISCNPETLAANLRHVVPTTHAIDRFAVFDQFPYTHHLECGVCLVRRQHTSPTSKGMSIDLTCGDSPPAVHVGNGPAPTSNQIPC